MQKLIHCFFTLNRLCPQTQKPLQHPRSRFCLPGLKWQRTTTYQSSKLDRRASLFVQSLFSRETNASGNVLCAAMKRVTIRLLSLITVACIAFVCVEWSTMILTMLWILRNGYARILITHAGTNFIGTMS